MCECNAYLDKDGKQEKIMEKVASIEARDKKLRLVDLWGKTQDIDAVLKELRLLEHKVILEKKSKEE